MRKLNRQNVILLFISIPVIAFTVFFLYQIIGNMITSLSYPTEYREAVNIAFTKQILAGKNPYSLFSISENGTPGVIYLYPFIYCYLVAFLEIIFPINLILLHYLVSLFCMLGSAFFISYMVNEHGKSPIATSVSFLLTLICHWRYSYISATPDSLGLFVSIIALFFLSRKNFKYRTIIVSMLTVLQFYIKQYFILLAVTAIIYFLFFSKKEFIKYFLYSAILTIVSVILVTIAFPTYWTYAFYLLKGSEIYFNIEQFKYVLEQFIYIGIIYGCFFLMILFTILFLFKQNKTRIKLQFKDINLPLFVFTNYSNSSQNDNLLVFGINFLVCGIGLFYFGLNNGAYLTYYLQLWAPSVIFIGLICFEKTFSKVTKRYLFLLIYCFSMFMTIFLNIRKLPYHQLDNQEQLQWTKAYSLLSQYKADECYYSPLMAFWAMEQNRPVYDFGHVGIATQKDYDRWLNDSFSQTLFPYAGTILETNLNYQNKMNQIMKNREYALITRVKGMDIVFSDDALSTNYVLLCTLPLRTGNSVYETDFWIPKEP